MDAAEALSQLRGANELIKAVTGAAAQQTALSSKAAGQAQTAMIDLIDPKNKGHHPASVNGHAAQKSREGSRNLDAANVVERFGAPIVLIESPSTINWASPASTALFAGQHLQWTSQADMHVAARETITSVSGQAATLFSHSGGIQVIAGNGAVSLQAHTGALEVLADKAVTIVSVSDGIEIKANQKVTLQAGQSGVTLEGGDIGFVCPGTFSVKGAAHPFSKGGGNAASLAKLPDTRVRLFDEAFAVCDPAGNPMALLPYTIDGSDGKQTAYSETDGKTLRVATEASDKLKFALLWHQLETK